MNDDNTNSPVYGSIVAHYEACLARHGPTHRGADWPNPEDLRVRFEVMLGVVQFGKPSPHILDLGCGPGLLLDHLQATGRLAEVEYSGIDMSSAMIEAARRRWPDRAFSVRDVLRDPVPADSFDYVLMNGVLTEKVNLGQEAMVDYAQQLIAAALRVARRGIA